MMKATEGILCSETVYRAAQGQVAFDALPPMSLKGKSEPVPVFRVVPTTAQGARRSGAIAVRVLAS